MSAPHVYTFKIKITERKYGNSNSNINSKEIGLTKAELLIQFLKMRQHFVIEK